MTRVLHEIEGFDLLPFIDDLSDNSELALLRATNKVAAKGRTKMDRRIRQQIAFPASYLRPSGGRLKVTQRATRRNLQAVITGRDRATSLARFTKQKVLPPGQRPKGGAINVTVKPGKRQSIKRAFLIALNNGNKGLAVRTDGRKPENAYKPKRLGKNLWLLYGPSVDQALISVTKNDGVMIELSPEIVADLEEEYLRQLELLGV